MNMFWGPCFQFFWICTLKWNCWIKCVLGKNLFFHWKNPVLSFVLLFTQNTSDISSHQMCGVSPRPQYQAILCDTIWVSYYLTQFWLNSVRSQKVSSSIPQDCSHPTSDASQVVGPHLLSTWPQIRGSQVSLLRCDYLLKWLRELGKTSLLKGRDEQPDEYIWRRPLGQSHAQELLFPWSWSIYPLSTWINSPTKRLS